MLKKVIHLPRLPGSRHLLKQKRYRRCFSGFGWDPKKDNRQNELIWEVCLFFIKQFHDWTCWKDFCKLWSPQRMDEFEQFSMVRELPLIKH